MKIAVAKRLGASSLLLALLLTYGCNTPTPIKIEKAELARIKAEGEIQAVHYSRAIPTIDTSDPDPVSPAVIFLLPYYLWDNHQKSKQVIQLSLEDPVLRVKERVVLALDTALDLKSVRLVQVPLVGDDMDELKAALGKGLVMDFKTNYWLIGHSKSTVHGVVYNGIFYSARSRIVRLEDSKILWQGVCVPKAIPKFDSWDELMAGNGTLLKVKVNELAESCVQELLAQLVGEKH